MGTGEPAAVGWRDQAVARVIDPARLRAEARVQAFLDAATDVMNGPSGKDFTVQEVVERSGQSLRSFYQYFDGKHELLLALFEDSISSTAEELRTAISAEPDALLRLRRFVLDYHRMCRPVRKGRGQKKAPARALGEFAQRLLTQHPREAAIAFIPLVTLLGELLDEAAAAGFVRAGLRDTTVPGVLLQMVMFDAFAITVSGATTVSSAPAADGSAAAEVLWDVILAGIGATTTPSPPR